MQVHTGIYMTNNPDHEQGGDNTLYIALRVVRVLRPRMAQTLLCLLCLYPYEEAQ